MSLPTAVEVRPIPGHPLYAATSLGEIISYVRKTPRVLRASGGPNRYPTVSLAGHGTAEVHRLVALAFIGPLPPGMQTRHLDGNPLNNRIDNLCYGTFSENLSDRVRHGRHFQTLKTHCPEGHEYTEANTHRDRRGRRRCRRCNNIRSARWKRAARAARRAP